MRAEGAAACQVWKHFEGTHPRLGEQGSVPRRAQGAERLETTGIPQSSPPQAMVRLEATKRSGWRANDMEINLTATA